MGVSLVAELRWISLCFLEIYDMKYTVHFYTSLFKENRELNVELGAPFSSGCFEEN